MDLGPGSFTGYGGMMEADQQALREAFAAIVRNAKANLSVAEFYRIMDEEGVVPDPRPPQE